MGLLSAGTPLEWDESIAYQKIVRKRGVSEFLKTYNRFKNEKNYPFKWGDELEFSLVKFDHENKRAQLLLKGDALLKTLNVKSSADLNVTFHPEFADYMIEATPKYPFTHDLNCFKHVEDNMKLRRALVEEQLEQDECIMAITNFPQLGCVNFTYPSFNPTPNAGITRSCFYPDQAIFAGHPRFSTLSANIRKRKGKKVAIYVPVYRDKNTRWPFREDVSKLEDSASESLSSRLKDGFIYLDATGFGMGCSCLQVTFQAECIDEARVLYDQLTPITPILLALTAASPIWKGYLSGVDCRWNVISGSVDDRTDEELGLKPLEQDRFRINKSRYDSIDSYLSVYGAKYNDLQLVKDDEVYQHLLDEGVDEILAQHVAHLFIRDSLILFHERAERADIEDDMDFFENIQSTNWQTMRFKPPPIKNNQNRSIGWRVEFRPMELQITDFENSAFSAFVILLTQAVRQFGLNFLMPISKVDENMQRAQKINACIGEKFYFRRNICDGLDAAECDLVEMSIDEIMNGSSEFKGFI